MTKKQVNTIQILLALIVIFGYWCMIYWISYNKKTEIPQIEPIKNLTEDFCSTHDCDLGKG